MSGFFVGAAVCTVKVQECIGFKVGFAAAEMTACFLGMGQAIPEGTADSLSGV
jgi:hypothetical protein